MQRISITNPQNIIDGTAKKYYFKLRNTGGPKGDKGDKGDTGATGPQGPQGDPCTVVVNSTATLEPGSNAYVTNTGSLSNAVLNFGIPKGDRGPQGAKGDKGDTGAQGETGPRGPQGERGTNATVYVGTTSTLAPGSQATVYNSGSDSNAVLNFGIPKGAKGDTGSQGPTGPAGQNFAPTIVTELPATGDESKLYLTPKAHTSQTATGNPITASVTERAGALESFQLDGDTFQQTYEGYNILPNNLQSQTINGITFTRNDDGSITIKGTATARTEPRLWQSSDGGSLVFASGKNYFNTTSKMIYYYANGYYSFQPNSASGAMPSDRNCSYAYIRVESGESIDTTIYPQVVEGNSALDYEPYVGGTPSPNPDYPQQIQTVTGEQMVEIVGKNLIDPDGLELGNIDASGNDSASQQVVRSGYIRVAAGSYTLKVNNSENKINLWRYAIYDNSKTFVSANTPQAKSAAITIANNGYIRVSFYNVPWKDLTVQEIIGSQVQLELGSTASAYTPYSKQTLPINLGKNLIDMSQTWVRGTLNNSSVEVQPNNNTILSDYIKVEPNTTYVFSQKQLGGKEVKPNVVSFFKDKVNARTGFVVILNSSPQAFTTSNDTCYIRVGYYNSTGLTLDTWLDYVTDLQLEAGSQATTYAPYKTPIELCKLGTYQDYILKDGDSWKVHKATGYEKKIVSLAGIDGYASVNGTATTSNGVFTVMSASWGSDYATTAGIAIASSVIGVYQSQNIDSNVSANSMADGTFCQRSGTNDRVYFRFASWARRKTVNEVEQMITDNGGIDVWYPLSTPTDTTITDTALIAQLETIRTASLENGTNTITNSAQATNLAGDMEIGYYGYNPRNRYDKWLWLDLNNNYEQIGS